MTLNKSKNYKHNIGENIKLWREFKGMKQKDLAKRIGKSESTLSKIESGIEPANADIMEDIADALGIEAHQLHYSPQQQITLNNCSNCNGVNNGTQNVYTIDKNLYDKVLHLLDKITEKIA